jgi:AraC-like DNA-binding protein
MLIYREHAPPPALAGAVRCFWTLLGDGRGHGASGTPDRILPDGAFELVFHLGDPFVRDGAAQPRAMLVGEIRRPTLVHATANADVIGVSFHVGGAAQFFAHPMRVLRDQILPLDELIQLDEAPSNATIAAMLTNLRSSENALAKAAVRIIRARGGNVRMRELSVLLGPSERTIERSFDDCVGMPPKVFARLMRFHALLANPERDAGYVDDSHLIHDFREFSGTTPAQFRQEQNAIGDAFMR